MWTPGRLTAHSGLADVGEREEIMQKWEHVQVRVKAIGTGGAEWGWTAWFEVKHLT